VVLERSKAISSLNLLYYNTFSAIDKENFKNLLHYKIRSIFVHTIRIDEEFAITKIDLEEEQINSVLQSLKILQFIGSYETLHGFFDLLKYHCPKLNYLRVYFRFHDFHFCPRTGTTRMNEVLKKLPEIHKKLKSLKQRGKLMSLPALVIRTELAFRIPKNSKFDSNWPDKLKNHEGFKDVISCKYNSKRVEFKSKDEFFEVVHRVFIKR